jgi:hypothetical protein
MTRLKISSAIVAFSLFIFPLVGKSEYGTGWVSEEYPPITCRLGDMAIGANCSGSYCDNFSFRCEGILRFVGSPLDTVSKREWKSFISEEYPNNMADCGSDAFITGMACKGRYCDNVSVECITKTNYGPSFDCNWVGPLSEEEKVISFGWKFPRALYCHGRYCDDKWFYVCGERRR